MDQPRKEHYDLSVEIKDIFETMTNVFDILKFTTPAVNQAFFRKSRIETSTALILINFTPIGKN